MALPVADPLSLQHIGVVVISVDCVKLNLSPFIWVGNLSDACQDSFFFFKKFITFKRNIKISSCGTQVH